MTFESTCLIASVSFHVIFFFQFLIFQLQKPLELEKKEGKTEEKIKNKKK